MKTATLSLLKTAFLFLLCSQAAAQVSVLSLPTQSSSVTGSWWLITNNPAGGSGSTKKITAATMLGSFDLSAFAATTSSQVRALVSDETGTGSLFFQGGDLGSTSTGSLLTLTNTSAAALKVAYDGSHVGSFQTNSSGVMTISATGGVSMESATTWQQRLAFNSSKYATWTYNTSENLALSTTNTASDITFNVRSVNVNSSSVIGSSGLSATTGAGVDNKWVATEGTHSWVFGELGSNHSFHITRGTTFDSVLDDLIINSSGAANFRGSVTFPTQTAGDNSIFGATTAFVHGDNKMVQVVYATSNTEDSTTTQIPFDDTIPQNTEGKEYLTVTITPKDGADNLEIEFDAWGSASAASAETIALFQDTTVNALQVYAVGVSAANIVVPYRLRYTMAAGTTSATVFRIRFGPSGAFTTYMMSNGAAKYSTANAATLSVKEYRP